MPESKTTTTPKRKMRMRHSRITMATRAAAAAMIVCLSAPSELLGVSAFVGLPAPKSSMTGLPTTTTTSQLGYMSLEQVSDFYQNFPLQSAVLTCGVKASVADTIAQVKPQIEDNKNKIKQQLEESTLVSSAMPKADNQYNEQHPTKSSLEVNTNRIDWEARRNLAYVLYGGVFVGLMSHLEYSLVFPLLFGSEKTVGITTAKVFFDNLIVAPTVWLPPAYFIKAWVYGSDSTNKEAVESSGTDTATAKGILAEGWKKYVADVKENHLLWQYWAIWFPAQSVSFSVVPDHLRVAFMASISFFWFILFSSVSSQGDNSASSNTNDEAAASSSSARSD